MFEEKKSYSITTIYRVQQKHRWGEMERKTHTHVRRERGRERERGGGEQLLKQLLQIKQRNLITKYNFQSILSTHPTLNYNVVKWRHNLAR